jgi:16S rRNA processing protein RimM
LNDTSVNPPRDRVIVARVVKAHGLRGMVAVRTFPEFADRFADLSELFVEREGEEVRLLTVESASIHGGKGYVKFAGIDDREAAEALRGTSLAIQSQDLPELPPDRYYMTDLLGMVAYDSSGNRVGEVSRVDAFPANDVLVIETGEGEAWVPAVKDFIERVEPGVRRLTVNRFDEVPKYPKRDG